MPPDAAVGNSRGRQAAASHPAPEGAGETTHNIAQLLAVCNSPKDYFHGSAPGQLEQIRRNLSGRQVGIDKGRP